MGVKRILCFGDSNTWGYIPGTGERQPEEVRWPCVCRDILGEDYRVVENGLNGRTTVFDDPFSDCLNGKKSLGYALISQKPLDLVVLMLGTNDLKYTGAVGASTGADELTRMILQADSIYRVSQPIFPRGAKVLLLAPPLVSDQIGALRPDCSITANGKQSHRFRELYQAVAQTRGVYFMDAAEYAEPSLADCVHITAESHIRLGRAVAEKIQEIFQQEAEG